jgi:hypothetical protein
MLEVELDVRRHAGAVEAFDGGEVAVQRQEQAAGPKAPEELARVPSASQGGVDERLSRSGSKAVYYLL